MPALALPHDTAAYAYMSPTLLSKQPLTRPERMPQPQDDWPTVYAHLESRLATLRAWRYSYWQHWSRIAEYFQPRRYAWLVVAGHMWRGNPINDNIIDSTGLLAVRTCRAGMWTGLTSPSRPWFALGIGLPWVQLDSEGKEWLEDTTQRIMTVLHQSNFYSIMAQAFEDVVLFGSAPVLIYEDYEDVIRLYLPVAGEYYLGAGPRLDVDTDYREFVLTVLQIVGMFTLNACPMQIVMLWNEGGAALDTEFVVAHAIEPNFPIARHGRGKGEAGTVPTSFAYREYYWLKGQRNEAPLSKRGFHGKPFMCLRWAIASNDPYGRSPCMDALGDNKQIQNETRNKAEFLQKGIRPPMGADPAMKNEPSSIIPGNITYFSTENGRKGFFPLFMPEAAWMNPLVADIKQVSERIDRCLYVDTFMAISRMEGVQPRNELELTKRDLERLQELGPVVDLAEKELNIGILRILDILRRRNMLKPMPKSMIGLPLKINYFSIMKLAQRSAESVAMKDVFSTAGALSSAAKAAGVPDPIRVLDLDGAMRHYAELNSYPEKYVFTEDEVKAHDDAREHAKAAAMAPQQAMAGVQAAKTLSETQLPGGNTALGAMVGGAPG